MLVAILTERPYLEVSHVANYAESLAARFDPIRNPARICPGQNTPIWQGNIIYVFHLTTRLEFTHVSHPNYYPATSHSTETMRVQIDVRADGTGVQTVTYEKTVALEGVALEQAGEACYGHYWGTARATSTVSLPAPVVSMDNTSVYVYPSYSPTPVVRESNWDSCWRGGDEGAGWAFLPPTGSTVSPYIQPWYHNGAFTTEDTSIVGRDRWANWLDGPGGNYVDKRTPVSTYGGEGYFTETSVRFTSYNLSREERDTPWLSQSVKDSLAESARYMKWYGHMLDAAALAALLTGAGLCSC